MFRGKRSPVCVVAAAVAAVGTAAGFLVVGLAPGPASAQVAGGFVATGSLAAAESHATATLLPNGEVLLAGGQGPTGAPSAVAELYNPSDGTWSTTGPMLVPVTDATATLVTVGGAQEVLVAGGLTGSAGALSATQFSQLYNPSTGQWSLTGSLQEATFDASAALTASGEVLYVGGLTSTSATATAMQTAELYDPATGSWTLTSSLPVGVAGAQVDALTGGQVLVAGGETGPSGTVVDNAEVYSPSSSSWSQVAPMPVGVAYGATANLPNGAVLVAGGETTPSGTLTPATQIFNPSTSSWQTANGLPASSYGATASLLGSGQVLYAGGLTGPTGAPSAVAELYNPSNGTWSTTGPMLVPVGFATATALGNGDVLLAGGQAATGPTAVAQLSEPTVTTAAPTITSPATLDVVAASFGTFTVTATGTPAPIITEIGALPPGMTFVYNGNGTATIAGTPPAGTTGTYPVTVTAANGVGTPATQQLVITVTPAPAPVVVSPPRFTSPSQVLVLPGANAVVTLTASGSPSPTITLTGTLPTGMVFHDNGNGTATISGEVPAGTSATYIVTLAASNGEGSTASQVLQITTGRPAVPLFGYGAGYWYTTASGEVIGRGSALPIAPQSAQHPSDVVAMATTPDHLGYYLVSSSGGVFPYGDAPWYGSVAGRHLSTPTVAIAVSPSGGGYYLVTRAGNVFNFGDAPWYGSP